MPFAHSPITDAIRGRLEYGDDLTESWQPLEAWHPIPDISEEFADCDERIASHGWDKDYRALRLVMEVPW